MAWDTLDTNAYAANFITLSGGGLTAECINPVANSGNQAVAQPFNGFGAGKYAVEIECLNAGSGGDDSIGIVNAASALHGTQAGFIGATGGTAFTGQSGIGYRQDGDINNNRLYLIGQSPLAHWSAWGNGNYLYLFIDLDNGKLWFRINNGPYVGLTNSGDPAAGSGGIVFGGLSMPTVARARYFPAVGMGYGGKYKFNLGATPFQFPIVPAGFTPGWPDLGLANFGSLLGNGMGVIYGPPQAQVLLSPYVCPFDGTVSFLRTARANGTTTPAIGVIYDSDGAGGAAHTLLAQSAVGTSGDGGSTEARFTLTAPLAVAKNHLYFAGLFTNRSGAFGDDLAMSGPIADLWTDNTPTWPTPNPTFHLSALQNYHLAVLLEGAFGAGGGGPGGGGGGGLRRRGPVSII